MMNKNNRPVREPLTPRTPQPSPERPAPQRPAPKIRDRVPVQQTVPQMPRVKPPKQG
jgi:hypothetical protein